MLILLCRLDFFSIDSAAQFPRNPKRTVQKKTMLSKPFSDDLSNHQLITSSENKNQ
ncbi:hypothetical protein NEIMUCOT_05988 [Neisseria mucosa ATCC 25996]|uniref:Uncharacterized protein n=1 Tax=Neisseria mucosa (strain ATCC 25996 / DSM 4631 / NCTC 10774 / M26) TaxID=546266 RepID=D2ZZB4_NEIM2|nr:hypothetical protein NEIMUCOT_05988 [Neisseria mucosa ATCC 25996]